MPKKKVQTKNNSRRGLILWCVCGFVIGVIVGIASTYIDISGCRFRCNDGACADANGCCPGEIYTDMQDMGWNCCPASGGDCFPPMK